ncbi:MAG: SMP-30/gluconolactonase/LRE family protein [Syntrophothermus sp.]
MGGLSEIEPIEAVAVGERGVLEAPRLLADGTILFADLAGGVFELAPGAAEPTTLVPRRRGVGGLAPHRDGGVVVTGRTVLHVRGDEQRELLAREGIRGFNDLHVLPDGGLLVGAMRYAPMAGEEPVPGEVWLLPAGGGEPASVATGVTWPNGIGISPDGSRMYVSDTADAVVRVFAVGGPPDRGEAFARMPEGIADGLMVAEDGGVWVALGTGRVARFDASGTLLETVAVPSPFVASLAGSGRDVVIAALGGLFRARAEIAAMPVAAAAV